MKQLIKTLAIVIIIAGLVFIAYILLIEKEKEVLTETVKAQEGVASGREAKLPVSVMKVKKGNLPMRAKISAVADVWEKAVLKAETTGKVVRIYPGVGDSVRKDQMMVKLDDREKKLDVESKEAVKLQNYSNYLIKDRTITLDLPKMTAKEKKELLKYKNAYNKALKDYDQGRISRSKLDRIKNKYDELLILSGALRDDILKSTENLSQSIVSLKLSKLELERTSIKSPFKGRIVELNVSTGEKVSTGADLLKIVNLDTLYLKGAALESEVGNLKKGLGVRIKFDAFPNRFFQGVISAVTPEVDKDRKTITIYVKMDNPDQMIFPGMHAELDIEHNVQENVIKVPREAILSRQERYLVFVVKDGIALWAYVTLGIKNDVEVEIKSGLKEGDVIVVEGQLTLAHQSRVSIKKTIE